MDWDASKYCHSLFWEWEPEHRRADSPTGMSSYSPVAIVRELHFCKGATIEKCTWMNTFSLAAQNPDIPEGKAAPSGPIFSDWGETAQNFWILKDNPAIWFISTEGTQDFAELTSVMTGLGALLELQETFPGSNATATGQEEERIFKCNQNPQKSL